MCHLLQLQEPIDNIKWGLAVFDIDVVTSFDPFLCISDFISFCVQYLFYLIVPPASPTQQQVKASKDTKLDPRREH